MRKTFFQNLERLALGDCGLYLLTANLGFKLFDDFRQKCGAQFIDVGVAEPNMVGIAAGLALEGKKAYCYSIIPFLLMRAYEQIRVDVAYHDLNVKLVGVGGGFAYGMEGFTHYGIEDMALMRSMPNMSVIVPADNEEAKQIAQISYGFDHPLYIRLGRNNDPAVHEKPPVVKIGKGIVMTQGKDAVVFGCGNILSHAKKAASILSKKGIALALVDMHTIKPIDKQLVLGCASSYKAIFTLEEHSISGGLGSAVAEILAENSYGGLFHRIGIPEKLRQTIGNADFLQSSYGLDAEGIARTIEDKLQGDSIYAQ